LREWVGGGDSRRRGEGWLRNNPSPALDFVELALSLKGRGSKDRRLPVSLTLSVKMLPARPEENPWYREPVYLAGWLLLDDLGAWLHDWEVDRSVPLCDPETMTAMRGVLPPGDFLGAALLQAWVRAGSSGLELHTAYWVQFFDPGNGAGPDRWGPEVSVRPVPDQYEGRRRTEPLWD
jgi:hypothetical protein